MKTGKLTLKTLLLPALGLLAVLALTQIPRLMDSSQNVGSVGGPFTLQDQTGRVVTDGDFRGKLMLIYFGYSFCPDVCPTTLSQIAQIYSHLPPEAQAQIAPIFITVDPERDTVEQLAQYVPSFSPALIGLTGSVEQIKAVEKSYRVYAKKAGDGPNYGVDHTSITYLMGKDGRFLRLFGNTATDQEILNGLKDALKT